MRGMERIREDVVRTSDGPWLEEFFHRYSLKKERYAYCLYVDSGKELELARGFLFTPKEETQVGQLDGFVRHLEQVKPTGFMDVMFALDTYNYPHPEVSRFKTETPEPKLGPEMSAVIEPLLAGSRGFILWHYQLEHVLGIYDRSAEHCRTLRKDFNAKRPGALAWMEQREVEDNLSLYEFVLSRVPVGGTNYPNLEGAVTLFRALGM